MKSSLLLGIALLIAPLTAQSNRTAAVLDLAPRNGETSSRLESARQALNVAGIPYEVTTDIATARTHTLIFCDTIINTNTLTTDEKTALTQHVQTGGVLFAPRVDDPDLFTLFGIAASQSSTTNYSLTWDLTSADPALRWIDDPMETTVSLGRDTYPNVIPSRNHTLAGALALSHFGSGSPATVINAYGSGFAYILGVPLKDVIMRPLLNLDYDAQRDFSNGFEPSADVFMLFLRGLYLKHTAFAAWKHTSPYDSRFTFMLTHDVDSASAMEFMHHFAWLDRDTGFTSHFMITTHYIDDETAGDFYTDYISNVLEVKALGHKIGSHSVGHFPDFDNEDIIPEGAPGNTMATYQPAHHGGVTSGASVYGELEVSRDLLTADIDAVMRVFRSGHLAYHDKQANTLEALGYDYDSSVSANDILTSFPFPQKHDRSLNGVLSDVWEIPMLISDVYADDPISADNYPEKVAIWLDVLTRNSANNAPAVLLVHPNRDYKVAAQDLLFAALPDDTMRLDLASFGDYWRRRVQTTFETRLEDNHLTLTIPAVHLPLDPMLSFIIADGADLTQVTVESEAGDPLSFQSAPWEQNDLILYQAETPFIRVQSPNGGQTLEHGNQVDIQWLAGTSIATVDLAWSDDEGANWNPIATSVSGQSGVHTWTVDTGYKEAVRIRIRQTGAVPADISDTVFQVALDGDLNEDTALNDTDLQALAAFTVGNLTQGEGDFTAPLTRADLDEDGAVNARDLVLQALATQPTGTTR